MIQLPRELVSLVEHVQLREEGWWEKGLQRLIAAACWIHGEKVTTEELLQVLDSELSVSYLKQEIIEKELVHLVERGILEEKDGEYEINNEYADKFSSQYDDALKEEDHAKKVFIDAYEEFPAILQEDDIWEDFKTHLLLPLVSEVGARTLEVLSGEGRVFKDMASLRAFVDRYDVKIRGELENCIVKFFNSHDSVVRAFVIRILNSYFYIEASSLKSETIAALQKVGNGGVKFTLLLDTNVVFSILGMHNNPSDDAVKNLMRVIQSIDEGVKAKVYIDPLTLDEAKRSFDASKANINQIKLPYNLAQVAAEREELNKLTRAYAQASANATKQLSPEEYFGRYLNNMLSILRANDVELYNSKEIEEYTLYPSVLNDITDQIEFEKRRYKTEPKKRKSYEQLKHDISIWHWVNDNRELRIESAIEAEYWIVTIDFRLLGFDRFKRKASPGQPPVCIHPTSLVQLLQLWVPRSAGLEDALFRSFQLPLLSKEFDTEAEIVTLKILGTLARYEDVQDLPKATIEHIVINDMLRQKMADSNDIEEQIELVNNAIIEEVSKLQDQLITSRREVQKLNSELEEREEKFSIREQKLQRESRLQRLADKKSYLEEKRARLKNLISTHEKKASSNAQITIWASVAILLIAYLAGFLILRALEWDKVEWITFYFFGTSLLYYIVSLIWIASTGKGVSVDPKNLVQEIKRRELDKLKSRYAKTWKILNEVEEELREIERETKSIQK